ncbi:MAG: class I SAM-dependent methyltransferase [Gemmatimonadales bacterium]
MAPARNDAWDCACGSGQATLPMSERFQRVIATDPSDEQLRQAPPLPRVTWRVATAEESGLATASVDAISVGQALHWFDLTRFWDEVRRVLRPGGVIVAWSYGLASVDDAAITQAIRHFHDDVVGPYWPLERGHVEARYRDIELPFARLPPPELDLRIVWTLDQLLGYLGTWSAVGRSIAATGSDPLDAFTSQLRAIWGSGPRAVTWPLTILAGRVGG